MKALLPLLSLSFAFTLNSPGALKEGQRKPGSSAPTNPPPAPTARPEKATPDAVTSLGDWGTAVNPNGDCKFSKKDDELVVTVPGASGPHDLAAEIHTTNAPRVVQPIKGDFTIEVKVDGRFLPGGESTLPGRAGYNGAGLVIMVDPENVLCLARAAFQHGDGPNVPYANFEIRVNGEVERIGDSTDVPLPKEGPVYLRLQRKGRQVLGAVSLDGEKWKDLEPKELPASWPEELKVGVVGISTSVEDFAPKFSKLKIAK